MLSQLSYIPVHGSNTTVTTSRDAHSAHLPPHASPARGRFNQTSDGLKSEKDKALNEPLGFTHEDALLRVSTPRVERISTAR